MRHYEFKPEPPLSPITSAALVAVIVLILAAIAVDWRRCTSRGEQFEYLRGAFTMECVEVKR